MGKRTLGKVVLIGGAGFVGSHLVDQLLRTDAKEIVVFGDFARTRRENLAEAMRSGRVRIVEGDVRDRDSVTNVIEGASSVFHLAAAWLLRCLEEPRVALDINVMGTFNVVEACTEAKARLVFSSTASVYADRRDVRLREDSSLENRTLYGATKVAGEQLLRAYNQMHGLDYVALRYFNVYGTRQEYRGPHVNVIMKILARLDAGERPVVHGDGSQGFDFIDVVDVARANVTAMESDVTDHAFNVCTGTKTSIAQLVDMLRELTSSKVDVEHLPAPKQAAVDRVGDPTKCRELLGFEAATPLREGLARLVAWRAADIAH